MKKKNNKNNFFGLNTSEKAKIARQAAKEATQEQLEMIERHGGLKVLKNYSACR